MREDQKRVRLRSTFHEKLKNLVSVLKSRRSQGLSTRAVVYHSQVHAPTASEFPRNRSEIHILRPHPRPLNQILGEELSICVSPGTSHSRLLMLKLENCCTRELLDQKRNIFKRLLLK